MSESTAVTTPAVTGPADAQMLALGEGQALVNKLNQHIKALENGKMPLEQAKDLAAKTDAMLDSIFVTRTLTFEKRPDDQGVERAPEYSLVKGALNTLRARCSQAYPTQIPAKVTKTSQVAARFGY